MGDVDKFFLSTQQSLPSMPEVARQLIASFDDEDVDLGTIVRLVEQEQSLSFKVLRLANSAYFARARSVTSLTDAAALLGLEKLRNLVLASSIAGVFPRLPNFDRIAFWKHSIATGAYAQWLSRILGVDPDSGYLAGFMLRSGQILIAQTLPQAVADVEAQCDRPGMRLCAEKRILGCTHGDVTAELARRWKLPQRLIDGFLNVADPMEARPFSMLAAVMNMAATMADAGVLGVPMGQALEEADNALLLHLRLDVPWLESTAPRFEDLTASVDELLG